MRLIKKLGGGGIQYDLNLVRLILIDEKYGFVVVIVI